MAIRPCVRLFNRASNLSSLVAGRFFEEFRQREAIRLSPVKHIGTGIGLAVGAAVAGNIPAAAGMFFGSWVIDLDHLWPYWKAKKFSIKYMFDVREFFEFNDQRGRDFSEKPYLHLPFFHTLEIVVALLLANIWAFGTLSFVVASFLGGFLLGVVIHLFTDEVSLFVIYFHKVGWQYLKRTHSIIEYYVRKHIFHEKVYGELFPESNA